MSVKEITAKHVVLLAEISSSATTPTFTGSYKKVGRATEVSFDEEYATSEAPSKDSGNWSAADYDGTAKASGSIKGLLFFATAGIGAMELKAAARAQKKVKFVKCVVAPNTTMDPETAQPTANLDGDVLLTGSPMETFVAVIAKVSESAGTEGKGEYDISFTVDGEVTTATVAAGS